MLDGLYAAASALDAQRVRQEAVAYNLANLETPGFKRMVVGISSFQEQLGLAVSREGIDPTPGDLRPTGDRFDLAIQGPSWLVVQGPGGERYSRGGSLTVDGAGRLATANGDVLVGEGGPIQIGSAARELTIATDGKVLSGGEEVGRLRLVSFPAGAPPVPDGAGRYRAANKTPSASSEAALRQGFLERSNAEPVGELLDLIGLQRSFEAAARAIETLDRTLGKASNELR